MAVIKARNTLNTIGGRKRQPDHKNISTMHTITIRLVCLLVSYHMMCVMGQPTTPSPSEHFLTGELRDTIEPFLSLPLLVSLSGSSKDMKDTAVDMIKTSSTQNVAQSFIQLCKKGSTKIVTALLDDAVQIGLDNTIVNDGFLSACTQGHPDVVQTLLNYGVNPTVEVRDNTIVNDGFLLACTEGHLDVVQTLIDYGLNADLIDRAVSKASQHGRVEIVKVLLKDLLYPYHAWINAIQLASHNGHLDVLKELLNHPILTAYVHYEGFLNVAIELASENGHLDVDKELLNHPRSPDCDHYALGLASFFGHVEIVKVLLKDREYPDHVWRYAIEWASKKGHAEVVQELLNHPIPSAYDHEALELARRFRQLDVIKVLMDNHINNTKV